MKRRLHNSPIRHFKALHTHTSVHIRHTRKRHLELHSSKGRHSQTTNNLCSLHEGLLTIKHNQTSTRLPVIKRVFRIGHKVSFTQSTRHHIRVRHFSFTNNTYYDNEPLSIVNITRMSTLRVSTIVTLIVRVHRMRTTGTLSGMTKSATDRQEVVERITRLLIHKRRIRRRHKMYTRRFTARRRRVTSVCLHLIRVLLHTQPSVQMLRASIVRRNVGIFSVITRKVPMLFMSNNFLRHFSQFKNSRVVNNSSLTRNFLVRISSLRHLVIVTIRHRVARGRQLIVGQVFNFKRIRMPTMIRRTMVVHINILPDPVLTNRLTMKTILLKSKVTLVVVRRVKRPKDNRDHSRLGKLRRNVIKGVHIRFVAKSRRLSIFERK